MLTLCIDACVGKYLATDRLFRVKPLCIGGRFWIRAQDGFPARTKKVPYSILAISSQFPCRKPQSRHQQYGPKEGELCPRCGGSKRWESVVLQSNWVLWKIAKQASLKLNSSGIPAWAWTSSFRWDCSPSDHWWPSYIFLFQAATLILLGFLWNAASASIQVTISAFLRTKKFKSGTKIMFFSPVKSCRYSVHNQLWCFKTGTGTQTSPISLEHQDPKIDGESLISMAFSSECQAQNTHI